jgi:hypothetical protein
MPCWHQYFIHCRDEKRLRKGGIKLTIISLNFKGVPGLPGTPFFMRKYF